MSSGSRGRWLYVWALTLLLAGAPGGSNAGRILGLFYFPARSHFIIFEPLLQELAKRGHQVDVVSHFPLEKPLSNYTDISIKGSWPMLANSFTVDHLMSRHLVNLLYYTWTENLAMCQKAMEHPFLKELAASPERFHYDVVLVEIFGVDCAYGYAYKLGAPVIGMTSLVGLPYGQERVGNPDNPAYVPVANLPFTSHMTLWERTLNSLGKLYAVLGEKLFGRRSTDQMLREHLGADMPSLSELIERNTSLVMVNSHFSLNGARPAVPGYLEVGGMHVNPKRGKLPEDTGAFLDGAGPEGAVFVSFGSLLLMEDLPAPQLQALLQVLGALPQRVVWRINGTRVPGGLPRNVLGKPWMPQQEVLSHPKIRAFISHGGLASTQEALHWAVPAVVVPFFTDQRQNGRLWEERGAARVLHFYDITPDSLRDALHAVLNDPSYRENARRLSEQFRDRPQAPLETAVWWTEYVMRHRGAPHLRSAAVGLSWVQLWLLDVGAVLAATFALLVATLWILVRAIANFLCHKRKSVVSKANKLKSS
ncbi:hypothetical protein R5R35_000659 [Gryllus longicercus]|uniref:UDP-glucuronosyltransferase n=1 Tax=Gryllus longicercus TaxID=2509291 RepID=A0AAN9Z8K9_9ORTH